MIFRTSGLGMRAFSALKDKLLGMGDRVVEIQRELTSIPAIGPENGGQGELAKALLVEKILSRTGHAAQMRINSPDPRVESGFRPNIISVRNGSSQRKLWLFGHLDVVPPGDIDAWKSDPWKLRREGDLIYGRGVEDNQQAVTSMLILAEALADMDITPALGLGLVFMSDEESGSAHGLDWILRERPELFSADDFFIVPDGGSPAGEVVEIAEKAQLWIKFTTIGRQCHASMPDEGNNAFVAASMLIQGLLDLTNIFCAEDPLFSPPASTFVPTRHDLNSQCVNILPGKDVFYMDCRLLPQCAKETVLAEVKKIVDSIAKIRNVRVNVEVVHNQPASATPGDSPVMAALRKAIASIYNVEARPIGIGGATVASFLRRKNLPAVVWSRILNTCHMPDECSSISATCQDAAVFGHILMNGTES